MSEKISKAQSDVWEVKERLSKEAMDMELKDGLHFLLEKANRIVLDLKKQNKLKAHLIQSK